MRKERQVGGIHDSPRRKAFEFRRALRDFVKQSLFAFRERNDFFGTKRDLFVRRGNHLQIFLRNFHFRKNRLSRAKLCRNVFQFRKSLALALDVLQMNQPRRAKRFEGGFFFPAQNHKGNFFHRDNHSVSSCAFCCSFFLEIFERTTAATCSSPKYTVIFFMFAFVSGILTFSKRFTR